MADIVNSLFGIDPAALQQQRALTDQAAALQFAGLDDLQRAQYGIALGARGIGRGITQLMGGDEQLNKATKVRQLASQFDMTNPEGIGQFAQAVAPFAPDVAQAAMKRRDEMRLSSANIAQKSGENLNSLLASGKYTPESMAAFRQTRNPADLELVEKGKTIGLSVDGQQVYQSGNEQYILGEGGQRLPYYGRLESKTPKTEIKLPPGPKNVLEIDKEDAQVLLKNRNSLEQSIPLLENSITQLDKGIIGGTFSDARTALATALSSAGFKDPKITQYLASTKTFNANRIELATAIAKQLGVNPTDRDFQASLDRFAAASENPASSKLFLTEMVALKKQQLGDTNSALNYFRTNEGSFAGYDRPLPRVFSGTGSELANMSKEQLQQAIQKLKNPAPKQ
jgi:hypothetical protein